MIAAEQLAPAEKQLRIVNLLGGYQFEVRFAARERKTVKVSYQQQAPCMDAHYILKTTQPWKRPLKKGLYRLFPHGVAITGSNYPLVSDGLNIRSFLKKNFMPTADWHFSWKDNSS